LLGAAPAGSVPLGSGALASFEAKEGPRPELGAGFGAAPGASARATSVEPAPKGGRSGCGSAGAEVSRAAGDETAGMISGVTRVAECGADGCASSPPVGALAAATIARPEEARLLCDVSGNGSSARIAAMAAPATTSVASPTAAGIRRSTGSKPNRSGKRAIQERGASIGGADRTRVPSSTIFEASIRSAVAPSASLKALTDEKRCSGCLASACIRAASTRASTPGTRVYSRRARV